MAFLPTGIVPKFTTGSAAVNWLIRGGAHPGQVDRWPAIPLLPVMVSDPVARARPAGGVKIRPAR